MTKGNQLGVIVLAAGKGTRMKSDLPKVVHRLGGETMLGRVLNSLEPLSPQVVVVITGHGAELVEKAALASGMEVVTARQEEQLGTAHAVLAGEETLAGFSGTILILCGDTPLVRSATLAAFIANHRQRRASLSVMTTVLDNPRGYGRIVRDREGAVRAIVEEKDGSGDELAVREVNSGIYCVESDFLWQGLRRIGNDNAQGEFYLTDLVAVAVSGGRRVVPFLCEDPDEVMGINSAEELARAEKVLAARWFCDDPGERLREKS